MKTPAEFERHARQADVPFKVEKVTLADHVDVPKSARRARIWGRLADFDRGDTFFYHVRGNNPEQRALVSVRDDAQTRQNNAAASDLGWTLISLIPGLGLVSAAAEASGELRPGFASGRASTKNLLGNLARQAAVIGAYVAGSTNPLLAIGLGAYAVGSAVLKLFKNDSEASRAGTSPMVRVIETK